jgi:hypothetical protein
VKQRPPTFVPATTSQHGRGTVIARPKQTWRT